MAKIINCESAGKCRHLWKLSAIHQRLDGGGESATTRRLPSPFFLLVAARQPASQRLLLSSVVKAFRGVAALK